MNLKDVSTGRIEGYRIDPKLLNIDPGFNVRTDTPELRVADADLQASIRANGVQQPFTVRIHEDKVFIVNGHRRHKAVMALIAQGIEIPTVPCLSEGKAITEADRTLMLITTNSGHPLTALERGEVFKRLSTLGWTNEQIGEKAGISYKQVDNLVSLTAASPEIKELISSGVVSPTLAIQTMKQDGNALATAKLTEAAAKVAATGGKVTAKLVAPSKPAVTNLAPPAASLPSGGLSALLNINPAPAPLIDNTPAMTFDENGNRFPRIMNTPASFKEMQDVMREILNVSDVATIHIMVRDCLKVERQTKAA